MNELNGAKIGKMGMKELSNERIRRTEDCTSQRMKNVPGREMREQV